MAPLLATRPRVDRAFERLYRRHATDVYRYSLGVLRNQADAEDVTQTTFLNAYRALERGEEPHAPQNWLIAIAHNVCRQRFRAAARRPREVELEHDVAAQLVADDDAPTPEDIRRALGQLAFNQRAAIVLREIEGRSYADIAEVLGVSVGAVETLIFRARRALREQLEDSLTCGDAERAISRQLDGRLGRAEKGQLRAHLRECAECRTFARRQRAQRSALRSLGGVPLPASLTGLFGGGGGAAVGAGLVAKAAALVAAAGVAGGIGYDVHHALQAPRSSHAAAARPVRSAAVAPPARPVRPASVAAAVVPASPRPASPAHPVHAAAVPPAAASSPAPAPVAPAGAAAAAPPASVAATPAHAAPAPSKRHVQARPHPAPPAGAGRGHAPPAQQAGTPARAGGGQGHGQGRGNGQGNGRPSGGGPVPDLPVADPSGLAQQAQDAAGGAAKDLGQGSASFPPDGRLHP